MRHPTLTALAVAVAVAPSGALAQGPAPSPIETAFCERETFRLADPSEVVPWLEHMMLLRTGAVAAPSLDCPSTTIGALFEVLSSSGPEEGIPKRDAFIARYAERAATSDGAEARYLNDVEAASFVWLFCSGAEQAACMEEIIAAQPAEFLATSPVFCDFAPEDAAGTVEWPSRADLPLLCSREAGGEEARERWHEDVARWIFG